MEAVEPNKPPEGYKNRFCLDKDLVFRGVRVWTVQLADPNPIVQDWKQPVRAPSEENQRPRATPKPKLAPVWSGQVQLADPDPVVRDWKHPARAPSEENQTPRATPKPKLAPVWSGQVQLANPNPVVRNWKHPVRAASEENYRPRATPKPKLAPLALTSPASSKRDRCKEQVKRTGARSEFERTLNP